MPYAFVYLSASKLLSLPIIGRLDQFVWQLVNQFVIIRSLSLVYALEVVVLFHSLCLVL